MVKGVFSAYSYHNGGDCVATIRDYTFSVRSLVGGRTFLLSIIRYNVSCKFREIYKLFFEKPFYEFLKEEERIMNLKEIMSKKMSKELVSVALLLILAILSMTLIAEFATKPETYEKTIKSIDEKKATVMGISATSAVASTALAAVPGDVTTPIANQLMELSSYLLIVVCALVLEKSLLTVMGFLSFKILIPIACILLGVYIFTKRKSLQIIAVKLIVFALVIVLIVPFAIKISDLIYDTNKEPVNKVTTELENSITDNTEQENKNWFAKMVDKIKENASDVGDKAKQILNSFIDAIAIFIIAYCAVPIIIILAVVWIINALFNLNIQMPNINVKRLIARKKYNEQNVEDDIVRF